MGQSKRVYVLVMIWNIDLTLNYNNSFTYQRKLIFFCCCCYCFKCRKYHNCIIRNCILRARLWWEISKLFSIYFSSSIVSFHLAFVFFFVRWKKFLYLLPIKFLHIFCFVFSLLLLLVILSIFFYLIKWSSAFKS